jgi:CheY-like chemotaxis protein
MGFTQMNKRRVLIVEDNQDASEMYRILLELAGHEVLLAENGAAGLELLRSARPDIAFVDIGLPGMDGYEIARRFRAEPDSARVVLVALTGYGSSSDRDRTREAGFDLHLIKPVDPEALTSLLDSCV